MSPPDADPRPLKALGADAAPLERLFSLTKRQADDRRGLARQLETWVASRDGASAAIYAEVDERMMRFACAGPAALPAELDGENPDGFDRLELPGVVILHDRPTDDPLLLIAAGTRISQLKQRLHAENFQAMFRGVELEALYEVGLAIASTLDLDRLGEEVLMRALLLLDARRGALYLLDEDGYFLTGHLGGQALGRFTAEEIDVAELCAGDLFPEDLLPGAGHLLASPVEIDGEARGLLVVADKESRTGVGPFQVRDRRTLMLFANQAAIALENAKLHKLALDKERLEREMELAAEIQQQLLPKAMPQVSGYEVIGWNRPARQVGGDYFGFQDLGDGCLGITVGDVTGKGMPAALLVSTLHSALRVLLDRMEMGPALIERLNRHICEASSANKFITLLLGTLDTTRSRLDYLNAGHNPGILLRADGEVVELGSSGLPVGLVPSATYGAAALEINTGDLVCLYSDGITECESTDDEEFGLERLVDLMRDLFDRPLTEILATIDKTMVEWADGQAQGDDQTVVLLRRVD
ncbi:MAG: GAF domain-containing SpoIIE family protein phosphatase [Acidobacteriota bacterium]